MPGAGATECLSAADAVHAIGSRSIGLRRKFIMNRRHALWLRLLLVFLPFTAVSGHADTQVLPAQAFDLLLSFEGDWIDVDGSLGMQDEVAVSYRATANRSRSEEHTSELQSRGHLVCRLLLEKKKTIK